MSVKNNFNLKNGTLCHIMENLSNSPNSLLQENFYQALFLYLLEAKQQAEQESKAKSDLMALVSHELRIPLTGILGMAHLLSRETHVPKHQKIIQDILHSGESLLSLINDLLDSAKLEAGKMDLHLEPLSLKKLINEVSSILSYTLQEKELKLFIDYTSDIPQFILGDKRALCQVLLNLLSNAIKFTDKGYVAIRVKCLQQTPAYTVFTIAVEDTGIGIPAGQIKKLFNRFEQVDNHHTRHCCGTGLGLSISKSYIEQMSGRITVKSLVNQGSTFTITIPFRLPTVELETVEPGVQCDIAPYASQASIPLPSLGYTPKILLIEDNDVIQKVHKSMLEELGCLVECATSGHEALQKTQHFNYDCIFVDIGLPDLTGFEVVAEIRRSENVNRDTVIIALTGYGDQADRDRTLAVGVNDLVIKPAKLAILKGILENYIPSLQTKE